MGGRTDGQEWMVDWISWWFAGWIVTFMICCLGGGCMDGLNMARRKEIGIDGRSGERA